MDEKTKARSAFSKFHHVGIVVRDIDKAVAYYNSLGMGPFKTPKLTVSGGTHRGRPSANKPEIRQARVGGITLELLQPSEGDSLAREFLETKGEGVNHIGFRVSDIEEEEKKLTARGAKILFKQRFTEGGGCIFMDAGDAGGVLVELFSHPIRFEPGK
jgi:methylmalonyl-CoA/ethylmalonyl-CoA epimerase